MSLSLYMDHNVPAAISQGLELRGIDVLTAAADGFDTADDRLLLDRATDLSRVVFTLDDDFLEIAAERQLVGSSFGGVVFVEQNKLTARRIIDDLELFCKVLDVSEVMNQVYWLPL